MTDERDDLLNAIGEALDIEPSPAFAARVRAAAETTSRRAAWQWWAYAAGVSVAAVFAVLVLRPSTKPAAPAVPLTAGIGQASPEPAPKTVTPAPASVASIAPVTTARAAVVRATEPPSVGAPVATSAPAPDLTVIVYQADVLGRVWASARPTTGTSVDARSLESAFATLGDLTPMAINDIAVEPIVVSSIESSSPPSAGPGGTIRRVVEAESARSEK